MFDLLSAITLEKQLQLPKTNYLVLHSLSMVEKARKTMEGYGQVLLALDSDNAGRKSAKLLLDLDNRYRDISFRYASKSGKDINDYLRENISIPHQNRLKL